MSIYINFRASCLLSLCGRGKTGSVKDRSLYILSLRGGGRVVSHVKFGFFMTNVSSEFKKFEKNKTSTGLKSAFPSPSFICSELKYR